MSEAKKQVVLSDSSEDKGSEVELSIALEAPFVHEKEGTRRAAAKAKVRYLPAGGGPSVGGRAKRRAARAGQPWRAPRRAG